MGDNVGEVDASIEGTPGKIAFNGRYLADVLAELSSGQVAQNESGKVVGRGDFTAQAVQVFENPGKALAVVELCE